MLRGVFAAALLAGISVPASAMTYVATVKGTVTSQFDTAVMTPGATSPIKVGDTITATFTWLKVETVAEALAARFGSLGPKKVTFGLDGFTWTSAGDFGAGIAPVDFDAGLDPLAAYYSTMDDARGGGDLRVDGYAFNIADFGYDLYTGPGFKGSFDKSTLAVWVDGRQIVSPYVSAPKLDFSAPKLAFSNVTASPAPEPVTWALMILGFTLAGAAVRVRKPALAAA